MVERREIRGYGCTVRTGMGPFYFHYGSLLWWVSGLRVRSGVAAVVVRQNCKTNIGAGNRTCAHQNAKKSRRFDGAES